MRPRIALVLFLLLMAQTAALAESRFGRPVIKVVNPKEYRFFRLDDNNIPYVTKGELSISCIVYRGTQYYYIEVGLVNLSQDDVVIQQDFISFIKPNYTVFRTSTLAAAQDIAGASRGTFVPTPPPQMPEQTTTTYSGTATTYGNQTHVSGTARTTSDTSAQAGANIGNAIGNALAARGFYKTQAREARFANFLYAFAQDNQDSVVKPGEARIIVATFQQVKERKAPFEIEIRLGGETTTFKYKE